MKALLIKDFLVITKQLKLFLVIIPIMAITGGFSLAPFAILVGAVLPMTAIAYDELCKWNEIAAMMPYSQQDMVISKYLLGYLCMTAAGLLFAAAQLLLPVIGGKTPGQTLFALLVSCSIGLFLIAFTTPILLKYGSQKGRLVFFVFIAIAGACGPIFRKIDPAALSGLTGMLPMLLLGIAVMLNVISISISLRIKPN